MTRSREYIDGYYVDASISVCCRPPAPGWWIGRLADSSFVRSVGAIIFGLAGDLYGRKWPMIINLLVIAVFQLSTAYCEYVIHRLRTKPKLKPPGDKASLESFWQFVRCSALEWEACFSYVRLMPGGLTEKM